jgi:endonuclease/exonuclease/phosphatase family metal-dependent hydrolase
MKIATWNLNHVRPGSSERTRRIHAAIDGVGADVWVLTETHSLFSPGNHFKEISLSSLAGDRPVGELWVTIWVRREIVASQVQVAGEPQRSAAVRLAIGKNRHIVVFGTVLPWRGDRSTELRGAAKFERSLAAQSSCWDGFLGVDDDLCVIGDFNQELSADGPVGTRRGRIALSTLLRSRGLTCVTAGGRDPLLERGWRASIDHVMVSNRLEARTSVMSIWPNEFPLPKDLSDHHGVCVTIPDA